MNKSKKKQIKQIIDNIVIFIIWVILLSLALLMLYAVIRGPEQYHYWHH